MRISRKEAKELLDVLLDPSFLEQECPVCGRKFSVHSSADTKPTPATEEIERKEFDKWAQSDMDPTFRELLFCGWLVRSRIARPPLSECTPQDQKIEQAYERVTEHSKRKNHKTVPLKVWADIDKGIAPMVEYLNTIPGVRTDASCEGTIGEGGPHEYGPYVMATWTSASEQHLTAEFTVEFLGEHWGRIYPKENWKPPSTATPLVSVLDIKNVLREAANALDDLGCKAEIQDDLRAVIMMMAAESECPTCKCVREWQACVCTDPRHSASRRKRNV